MNETIANDVELEEDDFYSILDKLRKKKSEKYKFILKAGNGFKDAIFDLLKLIWESEDILNQLGF